MGVVKSFDRRRSRIMFFSTVLGVLLSAVALSTPVAGDPASILTITSSKLTNIPNDYFDPWSIEIIKGKRSSRLNAKMPVKKELPESMQLRVMIQLEGEDPIEYVADACEAMSDEMVGRSFIRAGIPKNEYPQECPFTAGDWGILNWDPPVHAIPPGVPDGPVTGYVQIGEEGKEPYIDVVYEGVLSHDFLGR
ncbi:uncharacterized protein [Venturia canescens]|uniref:uncharacterized protein n=1 Tax=Venturia canescens TaxID=32260 RepID=UPI001C9C871A|nr:uncharacterized protein LOC122412778 [Venturia canescens]